MAAQDKPIKFSLAVDEVSARKVQSIIRDINAEVVKMVENFRRLNIGGMGGAGVAVGNKAGVAGVAGGPLPAAAQRGIGGAANDIVKLVTAHKDLFKGAAQGSKESLRVMSDALKDATSKSLQEVDRLKRKIDDLGMAYQKLGQKAAGATNPEIAAALGRGMGTVRGRMVEAQGALAKAEGVAGTLQGMAPPQTAGQKFAAALGTPIMAPGAPGGGMFGGIARALGIPASMLGVAGIGAALNYGINAGFQNVQSATQFALEKPTLGLQAQARIGQSVGGAGLAIAQGDLARVAAVMRAQGRDPFNPEHVTTNVMKAVSGQEVRILRENLNQMKVQGAPGMGRAATIAREFMGSHLNRAFRWGTAGGFAGMAAFAMGLPSPQARDTREDLPLDLTQTPTQARIAAGEAGIGADITEAQMKAVDAMYARTPQANAWINNFYASTQSQIGQQRALGAGWNASQTMAYKARANLGIDAGQMAAAVQQMGAVAGRGNRFQYSRALQMQFGGLNNAFQLAGAGAQYGGSAGFLGAISGGAGRGGLDVTAAGQIGDIVAQSMMGGGMGMGGGAAARALMSAAYTGTPGGDVRQARLMGMGINQFGAELAGQIDPNQVAVNQLAANMAAPGSSIQTRQILQKINPVEMIGILKGGKLPPSLASAGINRDMVQRYMAEQDRFTLRNFVQNTGAATPMSRAAAAAVAAGGIRPYLQAQRRAGGRAAMNEAVTNLGAALFGSGQAPNMEAAMEGVRARAADLFPDIKGGGIYDPSSKKDLPRLAEAAKAKEDEKQQKFLEGNKGAMKTLIEAAPQMASTLKTLGESITQDGSQLDTALKHLVDVILTQAERLDPKGTPKVRKSIDAANAARQSTKTQARGDEKKK